MRKRERAEGDWVWLCWGLALEEGQPKAMFWSKRALRDSWRWGLGRRARMVESKNRAAGVMVPVIRRETRGPFQVLPAHNHPRGA